MITCPLCHKLVYMSHNGATNYNLLLHLEDDQTDDFYCPTHVDVHPGYRWCHYARTTQQGVPPRYEAIIPPFDISWWDGPNHLLVRQFGIEPIDFRLHRFLYEGVTDWKGFLQACQRFQNLKAFS